MMLVLGIIVMLTGPTAASYSSKIPLVCNPVTGIGCNHYLATYLYLYDNPSSGGTINGDANGGVLETGCLSGQHAIFDISESPNSEYGFSYWSGDASGGSSSTTASVACGGSTSVTANYVALAQVIGSYNYTSDQNSILQYGNMTTPQTYISNSPLSEPNLTLYTVTGTFAGYPYTATTSTTYINSTKYVYIYWNANVSSNNMNYPGNATINLTLQPDPSNQSEAIVDSSTVTFIQADRQKVSMPDAIVYETSFGQSLSGSLNVLSSEISQQAQPLVGGQYNTFAEQLNQMSVGASIFGGFMSSPNSPQQYVDLGNVWATNMFIFVSNQDASICQAALRNAYTKSAVTFILLAGGQVGEALHDASSILDAFNVWGSCLGP
ncbi:MAG TPA: hypothetical protein VJN71_08040 [Nitrososphaerales archaeon]|nr:hypothetical protein [Nitrososphaerales archaeon]